MKERELRLLLTQKCNFKCGFCHKEGVLECKPEMLNAQDYVFVFNLFKKWYGWNTVSITGGEPLCRSDLSEILEKLYASQAKITLITNGSLLNKRIEICKWLEKLTVSVHTTDNAKYQQIVGVPFDFSNLVNNLKSVRKYYPQANIRFNSTIVRGVNSTEDKILEIIGFAKELEASIKFIELLPNSKEDEDNFVSKQLGTASPHCTTTNNVFLAADGTIKPCMRNSFEIDVLDEIKNRDVVGFRKKMKIFFNTVSILCPYEN